MIDIINLCAEVEGKPILKGLTLSLQTGKKHAIMGPNGAGKSTLAKILAGHPAYEVTSGEIWFKGQNLLEMEPEERAVAGLFMSFQYPVEIGGVTNQQFLTAALKARGVELTEEMLDAKMAEMEIKPEFKTRNLNEGFSGGEKKRNEILQLSLFKPDLAILDETDSGLDIDAMRIVAKGINAVPSTYLIITHYQRLLEYVRPDFVHVLADGKIVRTGGPELALELEAKGYA
jgi:Fe-S cluster assembly ATP-binding protein